MFSNIKELIVVMVLATTVFALARPMCMNFMQPADFARRRNVWIFLTACAFLSPSFWIYAAVTALTVIWSARRDSNPVVLYILLFAIIPNLSWYIPVVGINQLFDLSEARLLAIVLLVPLWMTLRKSGRWTFVDTFVVAYALLQIVLVAPYETVTNTMRRSLLVFLDIVVICFAFSRALNTRAKIVDAMAVLVLMGSVSAAVGIFESFKGWLMYESIGPRWGASNLGSFLLRVDALRAQASHGHSLTFGYVLAMAFAFWLHLRTYVASRAARWGTTILLCVGIYASHSRGPWFTAIAVYFLYLMLSPGGMAAAIKGLVIFGVFAACFAFTPAGERLIALMPFIGTIDQDNITYRQVLAEQSWRLIWQNPLFGDPFVLRHMENLRQGQGIIDLMNGYASITLFSGFTGLMLFAVFFFGSLINALVACRRVRAIDPEWSSVGAAIAAAMIGSAIFIATASVDWVEYVLVGMAAAYAALAAGAVPSPTYSQRHPMPASSGFRRGLTY